MSYKGILIDLDNTLYDYVPCHRIALTHTAAFLSRRLKVKSRIIHELYQQARADVNHRLKGTAASHNRLLYFQLMLESFNKKYWPLASDAYSMYWKVFINHMKLRPGAEDFLRSIKGKKVALVTDLTADVQHRKLTRLKLWRYIDAFVTSEEAGCEKPDPRIFKLALTKLRLKTHEVAIIGDAYAKDIVGARKLKIRAYWISKSKPPQRLPASVTQVRTFNELSKIIN